MMPLGLTRESWTALNLAPEDPLVVQRSIARYSSISAPPL
jgi:hypothetical protein